MNAVLIFVILILASLVGVGYTYVLNPTVVTASRMAERWFESSSSIDVLTSEQLESMGVRNVGEALQFLPGLMFGANGPFGMDSWVEIRGVKKEILVMVDGVPVNNPKGSSARFSFNLSLLPVSYVKRIEVVKGATSSLYGDSAFGGVINIITKGVPERGGAILEYGSDGHKGFQVEVADGKQRQNWLFSLEKDQSGEVRKFHTYRKGSQIFYDDFIGSDRKTAFIKLNWGNYSALYVYGGVSSSYYYRGVYTTADRCMHLYHFSFKDPLWQGILYYHRYDDGYSKKGYSTSSKVVDKGIDVKRNFVFSDSALFVTGFSWKNEYIDSSTDGVHSRDVSSLYVEYILANGLAVWSLGGRYEWISRDDGSCRLEFIPRGGVTFKLSGNTSIFFNVGRAFKLPTFNELYMKFYNGSGNPKLRPEYGWTYEMGIKRLLDNGSVGISVFYQTLSDYINWVRLESGEYKPFNVQDFRMMGVELSFAHYLSRCCKVEWGFTYELAEDRGSPRSVDMSKWYECGVPKWQASFGLSYRKDGYFVGLYYKYIGKRSYKDVTDPYELSGHGVFDLSLRKCFSDGVEVELDVRNLLDSRYELRKDFWGDGRSIYFSLHYNF